MGRGADGDSRPSYTITGAKPGRPPARDVNVPQAFWAAANELQDRVVEAMVIIVPHETILREAQALELLEDEGRDPRVRRLAASLDVS